MTLQIDIRPATNRRRLPTEGDLGFGRVFTDHMFVMDYEPARGWHDARIVPYGPLSLDPSTNVFHYGQAMFEGLKAFRGKDGKVRLFRPKNHCLRMQAGAPRLCMPTPEPEAMQEAIESLVAIDESWVPSAPSTSLYIRPTLIGVDPVLGVRASQRYMFFVILSPVGAYYADGWKPLRIWIEESYVRAAKGGLGSVKAAANYASSLRAAEDARRRGYAQVLWLDASEHKAFEEVGTMNLFVRIGDEVITAPLEGTILSGITRDCVLTLLREWGVKVSERKITIDEVRAAHKAGTLKEVFGSGTAAVISPVGELGFREERLLINNGEIGDISKKLFQAITDIQYAVAPDTHGWLKEIPAKPALKAASGA